MDFILVQNPPSIPTLLAVYFVRIFKRTKIIIDWHNYGYTTLALNTKNRYILYIARIYEKFLGKKAHFSFCVSKAMQEDLKLNWGVRSEVLYDKANLNIFNLMDIDQKHEFFKKIGLCENNKDETLFSEPSSNGLSKY